MFLLMLHEYDDLTGETDPSAVTDPQVVSDVAKRLGLGQPSDPNGWGCWYVES